MTEAARFWEVVERIRVSDPRYAAEAYSFVIDALEFTIRGIGERRHVSAEELLAGAKQHASERFGLLAFEVLSHWGIRHSSDIGEIVFQLVEGGVLSRREEDSLDEFDGGPDLRAVLEDDYFDKLDSGPGLD